MGVLGQGKSALFGGEKIEYLTAVEGQIKTFSKNINTIADHLMALNSHIALLTFGSPVVVKNFMGDLGMWSEQMFGAINSDLRKMNYLDSMEWIRGAKSIVSNSVFIT